ncbi:hypothetical protein D3C86_2141850 [compost metagenome]
MLSEAGRNCVMDNPWPGKKVQLIRDGKKAEILIAKTFTFDTRKGEKLEMTSME